MSQSLQPGQTALLVQHNAVRVTGYIRDRAGRWRYESTGKYVPGGRDLTTGSLWRFPRTNTDVLVPIAAIVAPELAWCRPYAATSALRTRGRITAIAIPIPDWEDQSRKLLGIDAPELAAHRMVDIERLAALLQTTPSTIRAYEARGQIPSRTIDGFNSPLWSVPIIVQWIERRLSNQPKIAKTTRHAKTKRPSEPLNLDEIDAILERIATSLSTQDITDTDTDDDDFLTGDEDTETYSDRYRDR